MSRRNRGRHFRQPSQADFVDFDHAVAKRAKARAEILDLIARLDAGEPTPELEPALPSGLVSDYGYEPRTPGTSLVLTWDPVEEKRETARAKSREASARYNALIRGASSAEPVSRQAIIERDDSTCHLCGKRCDVDEIHLDHVIPVSRGGAHTAENLRVACAPCNLSKGNRVVN